MLQTSPVCHGAPSSPLLCPSFEACLQAGGGEAPPTGKLPLGFHVSTRRNVKWLKLKIRKC